MPCSMEEHEGVKQMILFYRDLIQRRFRVNVYGFLKKNLREMKSWNKLYLSYKWLKEEGINVKEYWQVVVHNFEPSIFKHAYPFLINAKAYEGLYISGVDLTKRENGGANSTKFSSSFHVTLKVIGRDLITLKKLKISNKAMADTDIMLDFLGFFTNTFILSDLTLFIALAEQPKLFESYFLDLHRRKDIKLLHNRLFYDQVEYDKLVEYRKIMESYIDQRIDTERDMYLLNPSGFLIGLQNDLEEVNYMISEAPCK